MFNIDHCNPYVKRRDYHNIMIETFCPHLDESMDVKKCVILIAYI